MSRGTYYDFRSALAQRESGGNYEAKNQFGYLGAFQFGKSRLADLGICRLNGDKQEFTAPLTESIFLGSPSLQNLSFRAHVLKLQEYVKQSLESGLVAAAHLGGAGNLHKLLTTGEVFKDGNGVPITDYFKQFEGYEL